MPRGGLRSGAGRPKGSKDPQTLEKIAARELARETITRSLVPLLRSHIAHACGIGHLYTRDDNGKFSKVENEREIDRLLTMGDEGKHFWIFTKDPSSTSLKELLDRALDRPKEQEQELKVTGTVTLADRVAKARQRLSRRGE